MTEMEQLREDIRATAPQPRPEFAAQLERRVEAGFEPEEAARRRPRRVNLFRPAVALACTALLAVAIGAISLGGGDSDQSGVFDTFQSDDDGGAAQVAPAPQASGDESGGEAAAGSPSSGGQDIAGGQDFSGGPTYEAQRGRRALESAPSDRIRGRGDNRVVEQRTRLELAAAADEFTEVTDDVLQVADDSGSIVQSSRVTEEDGRGFARFDLRVPASQLDTTLADLSRLAHVTSRTASSQDITRPYVSATNRLDDARAERDALLKALERADTDVEAEAIRRQIRLVRDRIAVAERDVEALERRADRARVTVTVRSTGKRSSGGAWTPGDALDDAGRILEVAVGVVVVTAAALVPLSVLGLLGLVAGRTVRRRRREAALDAR